MLELKKTIQNYIYLKVYPIIFYMNPNLALNPIPRRGGGHILPPPTTYKQFFPGLLIRGGSQYTKNLGFVIAEHLTLVSGKKEFHAVHGRPPKLGR